MKRFAITMTLLTALAHLSLEFGYWMELLDKKRKTHWAEINIRPWLDNQYIFPVYDPKVPEGYIALKWWVYTVALDFFTIVIFFVLAKVAIRYSFLLFRVFGLYFIYHVIDHFMLWYNYKSTGTMYLVLNGAIILTIISMFLPEKQKAIVISLE